MSLMCCRLQELGLSNCPGMTDRGLLEGIGRIQELSSLDLNLCSSVTAQAWSSFFHQPTVTSIVSLSLDRCTELDDESLKGIAKRCNKLTYIHV
jgi:hypothetical protein